MHNAHARTHAGPTAGDRQAAAREHWPHPRRRGTLIHAQNGRARKHNTHIRQANTWRLLMHFCAHTIFSPPHAARAPLLADASSLLLPWATPTRKTGRKKAAHELRNTFCRLLALCCCMAMLLHHMLPDRALSLLL